MIFWFELQSIVFLNNPKEPITVSADELAT